MADQNIKDGNATEPNNEIDATISKHLDIAIEAQDGPKEPEKKDDDDANAKSGEQKIAETSKSEQSTDSKSGTGDVDAQGKPTEKAAETKPHHGAKDLVLPDGTTVKGGAERRFYEQRETARARAAELEREVTSARGEAQQFREKYNQLEETVKGLHGADPAMVKVGLNILNDLQRDPPGTMKKLLAEVIAQGYTVEGIAAGIDAAAIQRMIDERLPKNAASETDEVERITAEAKTEAETFFNAHPDAVPHDELLARMLRDNPGINLNSAYYQLKEAFIEKGFDWSLSLADNLKQSGLATNESKTDADLNKLPLERGGNGSGADVVVNRGNLAHEDEDNGEIVRQAMREAGMKI